MFRRHVPVWLFGLFSLWLASEMAMVWQRLPTRLATHFAWSGETNGWSTPAQFLGVLATVFLVFAGLLAGAGWLERIPDRFLNLPHKSYWLSGDRRAPALALLRQWLRWFLVITYAALVALMTAVLQANLSGAPHLAVSPTLMFGGLVLPQLAMIAWLYWRLRAPRETRHG